MNRLINKSAQADHNQTSDPALGLTNSSSFGAESVSTSRTLHPISSVPAVLLLIFKRVDLVKLQVESLRRVRPSRIYVSADGPRPFRNDRAECVLARKVLEEIDWPCRVFKRFLSINHGVAKAVPEAIDWFFEHEEEGIILEEDCVASQDFFPFCGILLERYRNEPRVMHISGSSFIPDHKLHSDYFYSRYNHVWGWATWKRAWKNFSPTMNGLKEFFEFADESEFWMGRKERVYWKKIFERTQSGEIASWAYKWKYALWKSGGVCVYPIANMVKNLGFNSSATNTKRHDRKKEAREYRSPTSLKSPVAFQENRWADEWTFRSMYWGSSVSRWVHRIDKVYFAFKTFFQRLGGKTGKKKRIDFQK